MAKSNAAIHHNGDVLLKKSASRSSTDSLFSNDDEPTDRESWGNKREFMLSVIGYCVGLGNIWRYPYICIKNGGGAFLIPFILSLIICGMPAFFLELGLGQFLGKSAFHIWAFCPWLKGIGISMTALAMLSTLYYSMILGWSLIYLFYSFKSPLPWTLCGQSWNTENCQTRNSSLGLISNETMEMGFGSTLLNSTGNITVNVSSTLLTTLATAGSDAIQSSQASNLTVTTPTEEFWLNNVLEISSGLEDLGGLPWHTAVALLIANAMVLFGIVKGIQSSGKVVYVTATLPYILLLVFLILGFTLEGSGSGALHYIWPDFSKLMTTAPWMEAAIQVFYSLGPGWGGIITMASYNKFKNNCMRDAIILTLCCEGTSIFGGFVVFMILGHMAFRTGVHISKFAKSGAGLVFVVYPEAISYLPLPQLWGFLFFLMLFSLGLDSMFTTVETMLTVLADLKPKFVHKWRILISILTMLFITLFGLLYATRGGMYWFQLTDWYIAAFVLLLQGAIECFAVSWIYGSDRFSHDIELMIGRKPYRIFVWAWKSFTPIILLVLWITTLAFYKPPTYEGYIYPEYAEAIGWLIACAPFVAVVVIAIREPLKYQGSLMQRIRSACKPSPEWMPSSLEVREKYNYDFYDPPTLPEPDTCV